MTEAGKYTLPEAKIEVYRGLQSLNATMEKADAIAVVLKHKEESAGLEVAMAELYNFAGDERAVELFKLMSRIVSHSIISAFIGVHIMDTIDEFYPELNIMVGADEQTSDPMAESR